jgi:hypothetical protein
VKSRTTNATSDVKIRFFNAVSSFTGILAAYVSPGCDRLTSRKGKMNCV